MLIVRPWPPSGIRGPFLESPETFRDLGPGDIIPFVSPKQRRLESRNFAAILTFIPLQHIKRPALQNKRVGVLRMICRAQEISDISCRTFRTRKQS